MYKQKKSANPTTQCEATTHATQPPLVIISFKNYNEIQIP
jgi:hypothetical protein